MSSDWWQTAVAQRAIVMAVIAEDHDAPWSYVELEQDAYDISRSAIEEAVAELARQGVVRIGDGLISASPGTRRLAELGLLGL